MSTAAAWSTTLRCERPATPLSRSLRCDSTVVKRSSTSRTGTGSTQRGRRRTHTPGPARPPLPPPRTGVAAARRRPRRRRARGPGRRSGRGRSRASVTSLGTVSTGDASSPDGSLAARPTRTDPTSTPSRTPARTIGSFDHRTGVRARRLTVSRCARAGRPRPLRGPRRPSTGRFRRPARGRPSRRRHRRGPGPRPSPTHRPSLRPHGPQRSSRRRRPDGPPRADAMATTAGSVGAEPVPDVEDEAPQVVGREVTGVVGHQRDPAEVAGAGRPARRPPRAPSPDGRRRSRAPPP